MVGDIVSAPQGWHGRHREHQPAAGCELRPQGHECALIVGDMFEHVEQHDQIIMAVFERHVRQIAALHRHTGPPCGERPRMIVGFDRIDRAELLEHRNIGAGAAADFQDSERPCPGSPALEQRGQDLAAADEPPVIAVDLRHPVIDMAFHQSWSSPVSPIVSRTM